jgi:hypothetical protein
MAFYSWRDWWFEEKDIKRELKDSSRSARMEREDLVLRVRVIESTPIPWVIPIATMAVVEASMIILLPQVVVVAVVDIIPIIHTTATPTAAVAHTLSGRL